MNDNHWYPRNPQQYLTDTVWCDHATEVAHVRMIDTYYALGRPIKDDPERICNIGKIKQADYARVRGNLLELGWRIEGGLWRHKKIEETIDEQTRIREIRSRAGSAGNAKRWGADPSVSSQTDPKPIANESQTDRKSVVVTVTGTGTDKETGTDTEKERECAPRRTAFAKPSLDEVRLHAAKIGLPESEADRFFYYYESNGWRVGRNPMRSWRAATINWRKKWEEQGGKRIPEPRQTQEKIELRRL